MLVANGFDDYKILDTGNMYKLEQWNNIVLLRPDPQVLWDKQKEFSSKNLHAQYKRSTTGGGEWIYYKKVPEYWLMHFKQYKFVVRCMGFKHTGLFPEQSANWNIIECLVKDFIKKFHKSPKLLNLFAYTGASSVVAALAGASVTHVDSAKNMVEQCKQNCAINNISSVRFIVDDAKKYLNRLIKRGETFNAIILDPPSYGRGPNGEIWKLEDDLYNLLKLLPKVIDNDFLFCLLNSYSTGLSSIAMRSLLQCVLGGHTISYELSLPTNAPHIYLPCGQSALNTSFEFDLTKHNNYFL